MGVSWREDPVTWVSSTIQTTRTGHLNPPGKGVRSGSLDLEKFQELYDKDALSLGRDAVVTWSGKGSAKVFGKSSGKGKAKSLGKGKGKGQLAIKDKDSEDASEDGEDKQEEASEEEKVKEATKKARKARDELEKTKANLEEVLGKANASLSNKGRASAEGWKAELAKLHKKVQETLHQGKQPVQFGKDPWQMQPNW